MSARTLALALILDAALAAGPAFANGDADSLAFTSVTLRSPAGGLSLSARGLGNALAVGPLALRWQSEAAAHRRFEGGEGGRIAGGARVELGRAHFLWLGVGLERGEALSPGSTVLEAGARARLARATLELRARRRWVDVPRSPILVMTWTSPPHFQSPPGVIPQVPYWEARAPVRRAITSLDASAEWRRARWDLATEAGLALARDLSPIRTARFEATRWIAPRWGIVLGVAGAAPRWLTNEAVEEASAWLGLRTELGPRREAWASHAAAPAWRWRASRIEAGLYAFRLSGGNAATVAMRGDFTGWAPVSLRRTRAGFETRLSVAPGVHHLEISIDGGAWGPPPGTPATAGTYGGEVGIFVAE